jgi:glycosyltransferase involved in cell wall biosynthesis
MSAAELAAHELEELDSFYCSLFDAPGKWGRRLSRFLGAKALVSRRVDGLPPGKIKEYPWPVMWHIIHKRLRPKAPNDWSKANGRFDLWVAEKLRTSPCRAFIGGETCARDSFRVAGQRGMIKILDCPQVHPDFLKRLLAAAADDLGVPPPPPFDSAIMTLRKAEEFAMADVMLVCSEVAARSFVEAGFSNKQLVEIPLWVDSQLWFPPSVYEQGGAGLPVVPTNPLKVLFVGSIGLRKGIPYLVRAVEKCGGLVELTLAGVNSGEADKFISQCKSRIHFAGRKNKAELREIYWDSDVLVLPSLVDTFGFVALEAMACGLPVIVTENCGVPVPDPAWRVPIMDNDAIAQRLEFYAANREALQRDGQTAQQFARQFTPERYREQIKNLLRNLLTKAES